MVDVAQGWQLEAELDQDWLVVRIVARDHCAVAGPGLAESVWSFAERHASTRLIIEVDGSLPMTSLVVGQLVRLHKRACLAGGALRLCGLTPESERVLRVMGLAERFPSFPSREAALAGSLPNKPR